MTLSSAGSGSFAVSANSQAFHVIEGMWAGKGGRARALSGAVASRETILLRDESEADVMAREELLDGAFGPSRSTKSSELLRCGRMPAAGLALAAEEFGALVGTVRLWHVRAGDLDALLLGPLAVAGSHRSRGVGAMLMREAADRAAARGHRAILLVGDAPYYSRFGFSAGLTQDLEFPGYVEPGRLLGLELCDGALEGASGAVIATGAKALRRKPIRQDRHLLAA